MEELTHVAPLSHAAAHRQRDRDGRSRPVDQVEEGSAVLVRCRDVEESDLIGPAGAVPLGRLDRIARIAKPDEVDALDDAPIFDVETGDDSLGQHQASASAAKASDSVKAPE